MTLPQFLNKLVALGSDGASVMLGKNGGVIAILKEKQPSMIAVHCARHRLELTYKDAVKQIPLAEKVVTLLSGLYYMYRNSPLNRTNLKNAFICLNMKTCLPTRAGGTRWVGHVLKAHDNFLSGYKAFRLHLEQVHVSNVNLQRLIFTSSNGIQQFKLNTHSINFQLAVSKEKSGSKSKAVGFLKLLWPHDVIAMALFLQDILTILHKVSLKFQQDGSLLADISLCIKTTLARIKSLKDRYLYIFLLTAFYAVNNILTFKIAK